MKKESTFTGVRWRGRDKYSSFEKQQLEYVQATYCAALRVDRCDLPHNLTLNENGVPNYTPPESTLDRHTFERMLQDAENRLLRPAALEIISTICAYQQERNGRYTLNHHENDPRTLLLEELKDWAATKLAPASCMSESFREEVERRLEYVMELQHGRTGVFKPGNGERSLISTLADVRLVLEARVLPTIAIEIKHASARDLLLQIESCGKAALDHGVQLLFYVLRNTRNTPSNCTITSLQAPKHRDIRDAMATDSGRMLQVLLSTPSFQ